MLKFAAIIFLFIHSISLRGQGRLKDYKLITDSVVAKVFDKNLLQYITLSDLLISDGSPDKARFINYNANKDKRISFVTVSFFLEFYSIQLDHKFRFYYTLDKNKNFVTDSTTGIGIPQCLLRNEDCKFISKDRAKTIAINDSMLYIDNVKVEMIQEHKKEVYYWLLTAKPRMGSNNLSAGTKPPERQRRLINAQTGFIQSR